MDEKTKNILSLNHKEAMDFFLKSEQYHGFELPEYFVFDELRNYSALPIEETTQQQATEQQTTAE